MPFRGTVLITGGTSGLGYEAAMCMARDLPQHLVVIASRSDRDNSAAAINQTLNQNNVIFNSLDLSSIEGVQQFAHDWKEKNHPPIEYLLLNAGMQYPGEIQYTRDGMETTFQINHVGHALLFHLLLPHLTDRARTVVTASGTHDPAQKTGIPDALYTSAQELAHPTGASLQYAGRQRYATSKLANVLWTYALHRRLMRMPGTHQTVVAFDPGFMPGTGFARDAGFFLRFAFTKIMPLIVPLLRIAVMSNTHPPSESGASLAWLAMSDEMRDTSGAYFEGRTKIDSSKDSYDEKKQEDLWAWTSENIVHLEQLGQRHLL